MKFIKWVFMLVFWGLIASVFHYTLPQHDIARITDTEVRRISPGENSLFWAQVDAGTDPNVTSRDVFFISSIRENGKVMVYRNEDTGWGWPPYFKFDTSNLQAEASDVRSTSAEPQWVLIKHYGWRNEFFTIFPNAISISKVDSPDAGKPVPWLNILILALFALVVWAIWVRWRRFRMARIDPVLEDVGDGFADASDAVSDKAGRIRNWFKRS